MSLDRVTSKPVRYIDIVMNIDIWIGEYRYLAQNPIFWYSNIWWHYTSSPFISSPVISSPVISSPVISSRSFHPLIHFVPGHFVPGHFVPGHFVPGHFVPWSFCPLVILSPGHFVPYSWIYRGSCLERKPFSKCKIPYTHSPALVAGFLLDDKWLMVCHVTMVTCVTPVWSVTSVTHVVL
jgi:hypothetical protein